MTCFNTNISVNHLAIPRPFDERGETGGAGNIFGSFLEVLMLALIGNGFVMLNGNPNWQQASVGIVLIAAVGIDALRTYRDRR